MSQSVGDCYKAIKAVEDSVSNLYNARELDRYNMHQAKSEDYASLLHQAKMKLVTGSLKFAAVKEKLPIGSPTPEELAKKLPSATFSEKEIKKYIPEAAPTSLASRAGSGAGKAVSSSSGTSSPR